MDLEDLRLSILSGASVQDTAVFLCRAGTESDVAEQVNRLGLHGRIARRHNN